MGTQCNKKRFLFLFSIFLQIFQPIESEQCCQGEAKDVGKIHEGYQVGSSRIALTGLSPLVSGRGKVVEVDRVEVAHVGVEEAQRHDEEERDGGGDEQNLGVPVTHHQTPSEIEL